MSPLIPFEYSPKFSAGPESTFDFPNADPTSARPDESPIVNNDSLIVLQLEMT